MAAACTVFAVGAAWAAAGMIPLPSLDPDAFVSGYGVTDNRRLLLRYGGLVLAALAGPVLALGFERLRGRRVSPSAPGIPSGSLPVWSLLAVPAILFFLFMGPGTGHHPLNGHELVHLGYLNEIEHGRILNLDTRITYGPLLGYSLWGFMKLVSFDLVGFRFYWAFAAAVGVGAIWLLAGRHLASRALWLLLLAYLLLHTVARLYLPDGRGVNGGLWGWGNLFRHGWAVLFVLGFAGPLARSRAAGMRLAAGGAVGLGILYAQETATGGLAALALLLWVAGPRDSLRAFLRDAGYAAAGLALVLGAVMFPALRRGALGEYLTATLEIPRTFLAGGGNEPYPPPAGLDRHGHAAWPGYYLWPAALLAAFAWTGWRTWTRRIPPVALPLAGYATCSFVSVLVRADGLHLLNVAAASLVLGFLLLDPLQSRLRAARRPLLGWGLPLAAALPLFIWSPGWAALAAAVAGRIQHPLPEPPETWEPIPGPRGGVWTPPGDWFDSPEWGGRDDPEIPAFVRSISEGHPVYIRGNKASLYYFLADVPAAASFTDLSSQCVTPAAYRRLFRELAERPPDTVLLMEETLGPRPREGYVFFGTHHRLEVFRRADRPPPILERPAPESP